MDGAPALAISTAMPATFCARPPRSFTAASVPEQKGMLSSRTSAPTEPKPAAISFRVCWLPCCAACAASCILRGQATRLSHLCGAAFREQGNRRHHRRKIRPAMCAGQHAAGPTDCEDKFLCNGCELGCRGLLTMLSIQLGSSWGGQPGAAVGNRWDKHSSTTAQLTVPFSLPSILTPTPLLP